MSPALVKYQGGRFVWNQTRVGWIKKNQAEPTQSVCGVIVAREISEDLQLACSEIANVRLFEYQLEVSLKQIN